MQTILPVWRIALDPGQRAWESANAAVPQAVALNQHAAVIHQRQQGAGGDHLACGGVAFSSGQGTEDGKVGYDALGGEGLESEFRTGEGLKSYQQIGADTPAWKARCCRA